MKKVIVPMILGLVGISLQQGGKNIRKSMGIMMISILKMMIIILQVANHI
jgi:predicted permease